MGVGRPAAGAAGRTLGIWVGCAALLVAALVVADRVSESRSRPSVAIGPSGRPQAGPCYRARARRGPYAKRTSWAPPDRRFVPASDARAARLVTPQPERRPENAGANRYCPSDAELAAYRSARDDKGQWEGNLGSTFSPYHKYVSGRFVGTTDEIIQWAAHKWGIPEDVIRAQFVTESWWKQSALGDPTGVSSSAYGLYPEYSRIPGQYTVYESLGISQLRWRPDGTLHQGTEPLRWKSTPFNVDYYASVVRFYFDDPMGKRSSWGDAYTKGDPWLSVGGWFSPYPWGNSGQWGYINDVKANLANRTWESPGFQG